MTRFGARLLAALASGDGFTATLVIDAMHFEHDEQV